MVKSFVFRYYLTIALAACLLVFIIAPIVQDPVNWKLIVTIIAGILSSIYFVQKQRLEELRLFRALFTEFNERYNNLNERLYEILRKNPDEKLEPKEIDVLYDYFNLCGEEYFYYKHGYIYPEVWKSWKNGMSIFWKDNRIREVWQDELETDSYYGLKLDFLRKPVGM